MKSRKPRLQRLPIHASPARIRYRLFHLRICIESLLAREVCHFSAMTICIREGSETFGEIEVGLHAIESKTLVVAEFVDLQPSARSCGHSASIRFRSPLGLEWYGGKVCAAVNLTVAIQFQF